jgi:NADPH:quinone reductase-like Zn-dependent oxidoreductase
MALEENVPMMRSLAIEEYCKPDDYQILSLPIPKVSAPDDVLIKVHAASINPIDVKIASGVAKFVWPQT